jgi:ubiquinone/menaquinone biosynthesis C-methylase UbiE
MLQIKPFDQHAEEYDQWFNEYPAVFQSEVAAIKMQLLKLGENVQGIEVGLGSGRFSKALGLAEGVEPAANLREMAIKRGIEVMNATAESLPYRDLHFDFVLYVTIQALSDVPSAFQEAHRVLKPGGSILVAFIEKDSTIGRAYQEKKGTSTFYKNATFYSLERVEKMLKSAGFKQLDHLQTLFGELDEIDALQPPKEGYGEGSFVVVRAVK